jgi:predicted CXXCH cytochrome family protein
MKRQLGVLATLVVMVAALGLSSRARGGAPADATYLGSTVCVACHKTTNPDAVANWTSSAHPAAMAKVGAGKSVADFTASPPFPQDKVAYLLGIGHNQQGYLDADLKTLPGRWSVKDKAWIAQPVVDAKSDCLGCHTTGYDPAAGAYKEMGVACERCHGPGSAHIGSTDKKGTITNGAALDPPHQAMVCGQCHSRGTSKDGKYPFPVGFHPGDDLDQVFTLSPDTSTWKQNAQYNQLRLGGGKHFAAGVVCTTCHDPHGGKQWLLKDAINPLCLKCHQGKLTGAQHTDQVLKSVTCAACHMPGGSHTFVPPHPKG